MERDRLEQALLFDVYGDLLTEKQRLCFDRHYNQDLSLGEIAELEGISRQAVRDALVRGSAQMQQMEDVLGILALQDRLEKAQEVLRSACDLAQTPELKEQLLRAIAYIEG